MALQTWGNTIPEAFNSIWAGVVAFLPDFIAAIVIFIIGWIIGALVGRLVSHLIKVIKLDSALDQAGFGAVVKRAGLNLDSGAFIGGLVKWFVIVAFLVASFNVLKLTQVNQFLIDVLSYLPQVIIAVLMLLVAIVIADVLSKTVISSARAAGFKSSNVLGAITKWSIWIFALLTALLQLGIAVGFIQTLFTGIIVALSLAFGLSFGLGGQEAAARYIEKVRQEIADHHHN